MLCQNHIKNAREIGCVLRRAPRSLTVFLFILVCCPGKVAAGQSAAPVVTLSASVLSSGAFAVGTTSQPESLWVTNSGDASLTITSITLTGSNAGDFAQTNNCGSSLTAGAECSVSITFTPSATGIRTALLYINDNASGSPQIVALIGIGTGAVASLSPSSLAFTSQVVGSTSPVRTVTLKNTGNAVLNVSSIATTGANAGDFAQSNNCGSSVGAGANCTISVAFAPSATGSRRASVTIADNAGGSPQTVSLSGTGTAPAASLSPTALSFGNQLLGTMSTAQTTTLTNTGTAALSVSSLAVTGANHSDFSQANNCVSSEPGGASGSSVGVGANCTISVTFTPSATGSRAASVTIADNAGGSPQTVSLAGTGTAPAASLSPSALSFGNQLLGTMSTAQTTTLTNTGTAALSISSLAITGANAGDFAQSNNCGSSVGVGANCTISVAFTPSATGSRAASVTIADNASGSPQTVSLAGTGTAPAASLSPTGLSFGNQLLSTMSAAQTVTLTNTGTAALSISSLTVTGANAGDFAQSNNCGSSVGVGANCTISVAFTPSATGSRAASVTIADNASGSPQAATLTGTGTAPVASLSVSSLIFGNEPVDTISSPQDVTLNNTGSAALNITSIAFNGADASDFNENDTCSPSVAAGGNCTIAVIFTPGASGTRAASLSIADNASGSPQSVTLSGTGTHDVMLAWTASTTTGVVGYYVYRGTTSGGECVTPLNSTPVNGTTYADDNVTAGATYYYVVTAVASDDVTQSAYSNEVSATIPSA